MTETQRLLADRAAAGAAADPRRHPAVGGDLDRHRHHRLDGRRLTLGEAIIAGLINSNLAFVAQGGLVVGVLAILTYDALRALERRIAAADRRGQR